MNEMHLKSMYADNDYLKKMENDRTIEKFVVRLPDGMRNVIFKVSKRNHRSMNSQIVAYLTESLDGFQRSHADTIKDESDGLNEIEKQLLDAYRNMATRQKIALLSVLEHNDITKDANN